MLKRDNIEATRSLSIICLEDGLVIVIDTVMCSAKQTDIKYIQRC